MILYEYPFNERIRTYLRLEHLYARLHELTVRDTVIDHHFALTSLFEIMDVCARPELKTDVLKDLDKQKNLLMSYKDNPAIDETLLRDVVSKLDVCFSTLSQIQGRVGGALSECDWLMAVRSRASIPGGTCSFDLPAYYAWQQEDSAKRRDDLQPWLIQMQPMCDAVSLLLKLVRDAGSVQKMVAVGGQFQQYLPQGRVYQLLRMCLAKDLKLVPEISVNRLLVNARFVHLEINDRSRPVQGDVTFDLTLY